MCLEMSNMISFSSLQSCPCSWLLLDKLEMGGLRGRASGVLCKEKPAAYVSYVHTDGLTFRNKANTVLHIQ